MQRGMEAVDAFRTELHSIYDCRLPVSRAKISSITRYAMKAVKCYKHVVMLVEKFISKSSSQLKLPGLYVMDSIIRQSRHQFGAEKDVFAPRFTKNITKTFTNLFKCVMSDQSKIVRVLNLWQKNAIYTPDVIQPLLSLAPGVSLDPGSSPGPMAMSMELEPVLPPTEVPGSMPAEPMPLDPVAIISNQQQQITELLKQQQQEQIIELLRQQQQQLQNMLQQSQRSGVSTTAISNLLEKSQQLQTLQTKLAQGVALQPLTSNNVYPSGHPQPSRQQPSLRGIPPPEAMAEKPMITKPLPGEFNKALLDDFEYSSDEEDSHVPAPPHSFLKEEEHDIPEDSLPATDLIEQMERQFHEERGHLRHCQRPPVSDHSGIPLPASGYSVPPLPPSSEENAPPLPPSDHFVQPHPSQPQPPPTFSGQPPARHSSHRDEWPPRPPPPPPHQQYHSRDMGREPGWNDQWPNEMHHSPLYPHDHFRHRSPSPPSFRRDRGSFRNRDLPPESYRIEESYHDPGPGNHFRKRSPPGGYPDRNPPGHFQDLGPPGQFWDRSPEGRRNLPCDRHRGRSPDLHHHEQSLDRDRSPHHRTFSPPRSRDSGRWDRREGAGVTRAGPTSVAKSGEISVCSRTIWVGHLTKGVSKADLQAEFKRHGPVVSIDRLLTRGCAYLVMAKRRDAVRALNSSHIRDLRLGGQKCKIAWAPGKGVKDARYRQYWNESNGVSYIPWKYVETAEDLATVQEGGWIDPGTLPPELEEVPINEELDEPGEDTLAPETLPPSVPVDSVYAFPPQNLQAFTSVEGGNIQGYAPPSEPTSQAPPTSGRVGAEFSTSDPMNCVPPTGVPPPNFISPPPGSGPPPSFMPPSSRFVTSSTGQHIVPPAQTAPPPGFGPPSGISPGFHPPGGVPQNFGPQMSVPPNFGPPGGAPPNFGPPGGAPPNFGPPANPPVFVPPGSVPHGGVPPRIGPPSVPPPFGPPPAAFGPPGGPPNFGPPSGGGPGFVSPGPPFIPPGGGESVHQRPPGMVPPASVPPPFPPPSFIPPGREPVAPSQNFLPPRSGPPLHAPPTANLGPSNFSSHADIGGLGFLPPPRVAVPTTSVPPPSVIFPEGRAPSIPPAGIAPVTASPNLVDMEVAPPEDNEPKAALGKRDEKKLELSDGDQSGPASASGGQQGASLPAQGQPEFKPPGKGPEDAAVCDQAPLELSPPDRNETEPVLPDRSQLELNSPCHCPPEVDLQDRKQVEVDHHKSQPQDPDPQYHNQPELFVGRKDCGELELVPHDRSPLELGPSDNNQAKVTHPIHDQQEIGPPGGGQVEFGPRGDNFSEISPSGCGPDDLGPHSDGQPEFGPLGGQGGFGPPSGGQEEFGSPGNGQQGFGSPGGGRGEFGPPASHQSELNRPDIGQVDFNLSGNGQKEFVPLDASRLEPGHRDDGQLGHSGGCQSEFGHSDSGQQELGPAISTRVELGSPERDHVSFGLAGSDQGSTGPPDVAQSDFGPPGGDQAQPSPPYCHQTGSGPPCDDQHSPLCGGEIESISPEEVQPVFHSHDSPKRFEADGSLLTGLASDEPSLMGSRSLAAKEHGSVGILDRATEEYGEEHYTSHAGQLLEAGSDIGPRRCSGSHDSPVALGPDNDHTKAVPSVVGSSSSWHAVPGDDGTLKAVPCDARSPRGYDCSRDISKGIPSIVVDEDPSPVEIARREASPPISSEWSPADAYVQYTLSDPMPQETEQETAHYPAKKNPLELLPPKKELLPSLTLSPPEVMNPSKPDPLSDIQFSPLGDSPASFVLPGADRISEDDSPMPSLPQNKSPLGGSRFCPVPDSVSSPNSPPDFILPGADPISSLSSGPPSFEPSPDERNRHAREVSFSPLGHEDMMDDDDEVPSSKRPRLLDRNETNAVIFSPLGETSSYSESDPVNSDLDPLDVLDIGCGDQEELSGSL